MSEDFLSSYLRYVSDTEVPTVFHRWSAISAVGAFLGRRYYYTHGHSDIMPNIYCMLIGSSGTRKSTAIKLVKRLIVQAGYSSIAAEKTTKEKFILDLSGEIDDTVSNRYKKNPDKSMDQFLDENLWGEDDTASRPDAETFIMADEFNDFFGNGNMEFISLLGTLWDYHGVYRNRIKSGKSVSVHNPTVSILGGNTPTAFALAFPTEVLGQGFFSRILLIHGESNGRRITFPKPPDPDITAGLVKTLTAIRTTCQGPATLHPEAKKLLDRIYNSDTPLPDIRFEAYSSRRFSHLLKLCLIVSASRCSTEIVPSDVILANTILSYTEHLMPKALGEFGKSRNSDVTHKIITLVESVDRAVTFKEIWKSISSDVDNMQVAASLIQNLVAAEKLQSLGAAGYLPVRSLVRRVDKDLVDYSLLTPEERKFIE